MGGRDGFLGVAGVGCPAGQGQAPVGACWLIGWVMSGCEKEWRGGVWGMDGWSGAASDFVGAVALRGRGKRTRCVWWMSGLV